jgi:hypothetical protein
MKVVTVRDRRLGMLHYVFLLCIIGYIAYNIVTQKLYLNKEPPMGSTLLAIY